MFFFRPAVVPPFIELCESSNRWHTFTREEMLREKQNNQIKKSVERFFLWIFLINNRKEARGHTRKRVCGLIPHWGNHTNLQISICNMSYKPFRAGIIKCFDLETDALTVASPS